MNEFKINEKKELANIKDFLKEKNSVLVELNLIFGELYNEIGKQGNKKTSCLRQFTLLLSVLMALIKLSSMPKEVKKELLGYLNDAFRNNQL